MFSHHVRKFLRVTAIATLVAYIPTNFSYAGVISKPAEISIPAAFQLSQSLALSLPAKLGRIESLHAGHKGTVLHIQTAHGHFEAQEKIEKILNWLSKKYGSYPILLEGAEGKLDPRLLEFFPNQPELNQKNARWLAKKALVTGPELFLLQNQKAQGFGIETEAAYRKNRSQFVAVLKAKKEAEHFSELFSREMEKAAAVFSPELRSFLKRLEQHELGVVAFDVWLPEIQKAALKYLQLDLTDAAWQVSWPMLVRFAKIQSLSKDLNASGYETEKAAFLKQIKTFIPGSGKRERELAKRVESLLNSFGQSIQLPQPETENAFVEMLRYFPRDFDFKAFPQVGKFIGLLVLQSELNAGALGNEIGRLEKIIADKLARNESEKNLLALFSDYRRLEKLLALQLTPADYAAVSGQRSAVKIKPSEILKRLNAERLTQHAKAVQAFSVERQALSKLDKIFEEAVAFYQGAKSRDEVMIGQVEKYLKAHPAQLAVVVTGGFHAEPLREQFEKEGYTYAVVTPAISGLDEAGYQAYLKAMLRSSAASDQRSVINASIAKSNQMIELALGLSRLGESTRQQQLRATAGKARAGGLLKEWRASRQNKGGYAPTAKALLSKKAASFSLRPTRDSVISQVAGRAEARIAIESRAQIEEALRASLNVNNGVADAEKRVLENGLLGEWPQLNIVIDEEARFPNPVIKIEIQTLGATTKDENAFVRAALRAFLDQFVKSHAQYKTLARIGPDAQAQEPAGAVNHSLVLNHDNLSFSESVTAQLAQPETIIETGTLLKLNGLVVRDSSYYRVLPSGSGTLTGQTKLQKIDPAAGADVSGPIEFQRKDLIGAAYYPPVRSESRKERPIWFGLDSQSADWQRMNTMVWVYLEAKKSGSSTELADLKPLMFEQLTQMNLDVEEGHLTFLWNEIQKSEVLESPETAAIGSDAAFYIKSQLLEALKSPDDLHKILSAYDKAAEEWPQYPLESRWPVMRAISLMEIKDQKKLIKALTVDPARFGSLRVTDSILLMLGEELLAESEWETYVDQWVQIHTPHLIGRKIYYVSPETWLLAGGLGRVGQYHTRAIHKLLAKRGQIITVEGFYHEKIHADRKRTKIDYGALETPIKNLKNAYEFEVTVMGKKVPVVIKEGKTEDGIPVFLIDGGPYYTGALYKYAPDFEGLATWKEFSELFSKASLELIRILEKKNQASDGDAYKAPVIWGNDGQTGYLSPEKRKLDKASKVLRKAILWFTTHTFLNRGPDDQVDGRRLDPTSQGVRGADGRNSVAAPHRHAVALKDPQAKIVSIPNGDHLEKSAAFFRKKLLGGSPKADVWRPTGEQILASKKEGIIELNPKLKEKWGSELNPDAPVISYAGRFVDEKSGRARAWTIHNIQELVFNGANVAYFGNIQSVPNYDFDELKSKAETINREAARREALGGPKLGRVIVATGWGLDDQVEILGISHIVVGDSNFKTGASEITEMNGTVNGALIMGPAWTEGNIQKIGIVLNPKVPGSGNILIPKDAAPSSYLKVLLEQVKTFKENPAHFGSYLETSVQLSRVVNALMPGAQYMREFESILNRQENLESLRDMVKEIRSSIQQGQPLPEKLAKWIEEISKMSREEAEKKYGEEKLFVVASLAVFLAPEKLDSFKSWELPQFSMLENYVNDSPNQPLFGEGATLRLHRASHQDVFMLSRSNSKTGRVLAPFFYLGIEPWDQQANKVWARDVENMSSLLIASNDVFYSVGDYSIAGGDKVRFYDKAPSGSDLLRDFRGGVPISDHFAPDVNMNHIGLHTQLLLLQQKSRSEARTLQARNGIKYEIDHDPQVGAYVIKQDDPSRTKIYLPGESYYDDDTTKAIYELSPDGRFLIMGGMLGTVPARLALMGGAAFESVRLYDLTKISKPEEVEFSVAQLIPLGVKTAPEEQPRPAAVLAHTYRGIYFTQDSKALVVLMPGPRKFSLQDKILVFSTETGEIISLENNPDSFGEVANRGFDEKGIVVRLRNSHAEHGKLVRYDTTTGKLLAWSDSSDLSLFELEMSNGNSLEMLRSGQRVVWSQNREGEYGIFSLLTGAILTIPAQSGRFKAESVAFSDSQKDSLTVTFQDGTSRQIRAVRESGQEDYKLVIRSESREEVYGGEPKESTRVNDTRPQEVLNQGKMGDYRDDAQKTKRSELRFTVIEKRGAQEKLTKKYEWARVLESRGMKLVLLESKAALRNLFPAMSEPWMQSWIDERALFSQGTHDLLVILGPSGNWVHGLLPIKQNAEVNLAAAEGAFDPYGHETREVLMRFGLPQSQAHTVSANASLEQTRIPHWIGLDKNTLHVFRSEARLTDTAAAKILFNHLARQDENIPEDHTLVVLGNPLPGYSEAVVNLARQRQSPRIVIVGGGKAAESEWFRIYREIVQIAPDLQSKIWVDTSDKSQNTGENVAVALKILKQHDVSNPNVVIAQMPTGTLLSQRIFEWQAPAQAEKLGLPKFNFFSAAPNMPALQIQDDQPFTEENIAALRHALGQIERFQTWPSENSAGNGRALIGRVEGDLNPLVAEAAKTIWETVAHRDLGPSSVVRVPIKFPQHSAIRAFTDPQTGLNTQFGGKKYDPAFNSGELTVVTDAEGKIPLAIEFGAFRVLIGRDNPVQVIDSQGDAKLFESPYQSSYLNFIHLLHAVSGGRHAAEKSSYGRVGNAVAELDSEKNKNELELLQKALEGLEELILKQFANLGATATGLDLIYAHLAQNASEGDFYQVKVDVTAANNSQQSFVIKQPYLTALDNANFMRLMQHIASKIPQNAKGFKISVDALHASIRVSGGKKIPAEYQSASLQGVLERILTGQKFGEQNFEEIVYAAIKASQGVAVIPVAAAGGRKGAFELAKEAHLRGSAVEFTFRGKEEDVIGAIQDFRAWLRERGDTEDRILIAAGTVHTADQAQKAIEAGVNIIVSPGMFPEVIKRVVFMKNILRYRAAAIPAVETVSEAQEAIRFGATALKFYPPVLAGDKVATFQMEKMGPLPTDIDKRDLQKEAQALIKDGTLKFVLQSSNIGLPVATYTALFNYLYQKPEERKPITFAVPASWGLEEGSNLRSILAMSEVVSGTKPVVVTAGKLDPQDVAAVLDLPGVIGIGSVVKNLAEYLPFVEAVAAKKRSEARKNRSEMHAEHGISRNTFLRISLLGSLAWGASLVEAWGTPIPVSKQNIRQAESILKPLNLPQTSSDKKMAWNALRDVLAEKIAGLLADKKQKPEQILADFNSKPELINAAYENALHFIEETGDAEDADGKSIQAMEPDERQKKLLDVLRQALTRSEARLISESAAALSNAKVMTLITLNEGYEKAYALAKYVIQKDLIPEIALRGTAEQRAQALDLIKNLRGEFPQAVIGVGSISSVEQVHAAYNAGADILVSPNFNPEVVSSAKALQVLMTPGIRSLDEAREAYAAGLRIVKVFPFTIKSPGGVFETRRDEYLAAVKAPLPEEQHQYLTKEMFVESQDAPIGTPGQIYAALAHGDYKASFRLPETWGADVIDEIRAELPDMQLMLTGGIKAGDYSNLLKTDGIIAIGASVKDEASVDTLAASRSEARNSIKDLARKVAASRFVGLIPVAKVGVGVENAVKIGAAAIRNGIIPEIVFRGKEEDTLNALRQLRALFPDKAKYPIAAGTVHTARQVELAYEAGATVVISPGMFPEVIAKANELGMLAVPGVGTLEEAREAVRLGAASMKFFPTYLNGNNPAERIENFTKKIREPLPEELQARFDDFIKSSKITFVEFDPDSTERSGFDQVASYTAIYDFLNHNQEQPIVFGVPSRTKTLLDGYLGQILRDEETRTVPIVATGLAGLSFEDMAQVRDQLRSRHFQRISNVGTTIDSEAAVSKIADEFSLQAHQDPYETTKTRNFRIRGIGAPLLFIAAAIFIFGFNYIAAVEMPKLGIIFIVGILFLGIVLPIWHLVTFSKAQKHFNADVLKQGMRRYYGFWTRHFSMPYEKSSVQDLKRFNDRAERASGISADKRKQLEKEEILAQEFDRQPRDPAFDSSEPVASFWYPRWYEDMTPQALTYAFPEFRKALQGLDSHTKQKLLFFARNLTVAERNARMAMTIHNLDQGALAKSWEHYAASDIYFDVHEVLEILSRKGVIVPSRMVGDKIFYPSSQVSVSRDGFDRFTMNYPLLDFIRKVIPRSESRVQRSEWRSAYTASVGAAGATANLTRTLLSLIFQPNLDALQSAAARIPYTFPESLIIRGVGIIRDRRIPKAEIETYAKALQAAEQYASLPDNLDLYVWDLLKTLGFDLGSQPSRQRAAAFLEVLIARSETRVQRSEYRFGEVKENIVPTVTWFKDQHGQIVLDEETTAKYLDYLRDEMKVKTLLINGATGEFHKMSRVMRGIVIEKMTRMAKERGFNVVAHVTGLKEGSDGMQGAFDETLRNAEIAKNAGADAVAVLPLGILEDHSDEIPILLKGLKRVTEDLPVTLYNNPALHVEPGVSLYPDDVSKWFSEGLVDAVKDSSGNREKTLAFIAINDLQRGKLPVYVGNEADIAWAIENGAAGAVGSSGSWSPVLQKIPTETHGRLQAAQAGIESFRKILTAFGSQHALRIPSGLKYALAGRLGGQALLATGENAETALTAEQKSAIDNLFTMGDSYNFYLKNIEPGQPAPKTNIEPSENIKTAVQVLKRAVGDQQASVSAVEVSFRDQRYVVFSVGELQGDEYEFKFYLWDEKAPDLVNDLKTVRTSKDVMTGNPTADRPEFSMRDPRHTGGTGSLITVTISVLVGLYRAENHHFEVKAGVNAEDIKVVSFGSGGFLRMILSMIQDSGYKGKAVMVQPRGAATVDALISSDYRYNLKVSSIDGTETKLVDNVVSAGSIGTDDGKEKLHALTAQLNLDLVLVGVTDGAFKPNEPVWNDLAQFLFAYFKSRTDANHDQPLSIINTDNKSWNGDLIRGFMNGLAATVAESQETEFKAWLEKSVRFHNSMVDRIVAGAEKAPQNAVTEPAPKLTLAVDGELAPGLAQLRNVSQFQFGRSRELLQRDYDLKLRVANATHTALVYAAALQGIRYTRDAIKFYKLYLSNLFEKDILPGLKRDGFGEIYAQKFFEEWVSRLENPVMPHMNHWIAQSGFDKVMQRFMRTIIANGKGSDEMAFAIAVLLRYFTRTGTIEKTEKKTVVSVGQRDPGAQGGKSYDYVSGLDAHDTTYEFVETSRGDLSAKTLSLLEGLLTETDDKVIGARISQVLALFKTQSGISFSDYPDLSQKIIELYTQMAKGKSSLAVLASVVQRAELRANEQPVLDQIMAHQIANELLTEKWENAPAYFWDKVIIEIEAMTADTLPITWREWRWFFDAQDAATAEARFGEFLAQARTKFAAIKPNAMLKMDTGASLETSVVDGYEVYSLWTHPIAGQPVSKLRISSLGANTLSMITTADGKTSHETVWHAGNNGEKLVDDKTGAVLGGGIPIMFPWVSRIRDSVFRWGRKIFRIDGKSPYVRLFKDKHALHGVADKMRFKKVSHVFNDDGSVEITLLLQTADYPELRDQTNLGNAEVYVTHKLSRTGEHEIKLRVKNLNPKKAIRFAAGWHSFFNLIGDNWKLIARANAVRRVDDDQIALPQHSVPVEGESDIRHLSSGAVHREFLLERLEENERGEFVSAFYDYATHRRLTVKQKGFTGLTAWVPRKAGLEHLKNVFSFQPRSGSSDAHNLYHSFMGIFAGLVGWLEEVIGFKWVELFGYVEARRAGLVVVAPGAEWEAVMQTQETIDPDFELHIGRLGGNADILGWPLEGNRTDLKVKSGSIIQYRQWTIQIQVDVEKKMVSFVKLREGKREELKDFSPGVVKIETDGSAILAVGHIDPLTVTDAEIIASTRSEQRSAEQLKAQSDRWMFVAAISFAVSMVGVFFLGFAGVSLGFPTVFMPWIVGATGVGVVVPGLMALNGLRLGRLADAAAVSRSEYRSEGEWSGFRYFVSVGAAAVLFVAVLPVIAIVGTLLRLKKEQGNVQLRNLSRAELRAKLQILMDWFKQPKVLLGVSLLGVVAAGYFAYPWVIPYLLAKNIGSVIAGTSAFVLLLWFISISQDQRNLRASAEVLWFKNVGVDADANLSDEADTSLSATVSLAAVLQRQIINFTEILPVILGAVPQGFANINGKLTPVPQAQVLAKLTDVDAIRALLDDKGDFEANVKNVSAIIVQLLAIPGNRVEWGVMDWQSLLATAAQFNGDFVVEFEPAQYVLEGAPHFPSMGALVGDINELTTPDVFRRQISSQKITLIARSELRAADWSQEAAASEVEKRLGVTIRGKAGYKWDSRVNSEIKLDRGLSVGVQLHGNQAKWFVEIDKVDTVPSSKFLPSIAAGIDSAVEEMAEASGYNVKVIPSAMTEVAGVRGTARRYILTARAETRTDGPIESFSKLVDGKTRENNDWVSDLKDDVKPFLWRGFFAGGLSSFLWIYFNSEAIDSGSISKLATYSVVIGFFLGGAILAGLIIFLIANFMDKPVKLEIFTAIHEKLHSPLNQKVALDSLLVQLQGKNFPKESQEAELQQASLAAIQFELHELAIAESADISQPETFSDPTDLIEWINAYVLSKDAKEDESGRRKQWAFIVGADDYGDRRDGVILNWSEYSKPDDLQVTVWNRFEMDFIGNRTIDIHFNDAFKDGGKVTIRIISSKEPISAKHALAVIIPEKAPQITKIKASNPPRKAVWLSYEEGLKLIRAHLPPLKSDETPPKNVSIVLHHYAYEWTSWKAVTFTNRGPKTNFSYAVPETDYFVVEPDGTIKLVRKEGNRLPDKKFNSFRKKLEQSTADALTAFQAGTPRAELRDSMTAQTLDADTAVAYGIIQSKYLMVAPAGQVVRKAYDLGDYRYLFVLNAFDGFPGGRNTPHKAGLYLVSASDDKVFSFEGNTGIDDVIVGADQGFPFTFAVKNNDAVDVFSVPVENGALQKLWSGKIKAPASAELLLSNSPSATADQSKMYLYAVGAQLSEPRIFAAFEMNGAQLRLVEESKPAVAAPRNKTALVAGQEVQVLVTGEHKESGGSTLLGYFVTYQSNGKTVKGYFELKDGDGLLSLNRTVSRVVVAVGSETVGEEAVEFRVATNRAEIRKQSRSELKAVAPASVVHLTLAAARIKLSQLLLGGILSKGLMDQIKREVQNAGPEIIAARLFHEFGIQVHITDIPQEAVGALEAYNSAAIFAAPAAKAVHVNTDIILDSAHLDMLIESKNVQGLFEILKDTQGHLILLDTAGDLKSRLLRIITNGKLKLPVLDQRLAMGWIDAIKFVRDPAEISQLAMKPGVAMLLKSGSAMNDAKGQIVLALMNALTAKDYPLLIALMRDLRQAAALGDIAGAEAYLNRVTAGRLQRRQGGGWTTLVEIEILVRSAELVDISA